MDVKPYRPSIVDFDAADVAELNGLIYTQTEQGALKMDCFWDDTVKTAKPAVIWIHGGGFTEAHITRKSRPEDKFLELVRRGFFVASIDYRLAQVAAYPAQLSDCKDAIRFLKNNAARFGIDKDRIAVWGESCGGQMAGVLAVKGGIPGFEGDDADVCAAVSWYGSLDLAGFVRSRIDTCEEVGYASFRDRFREMFGDVPENLWPMLEAHSAATYAEGPMAPVLAMFGGDDFRVDSNLCCGDFFEKAKKAGNIAIYKNVPGQGHGYFGGEENDALLYGFLTEHTR